MARPCLWLVCVGSKERERLADNLHCFELADSRKQHFHCGLTDDPEVVASIIGLLASNLVGAPMGTESAWTIRKWVLVRLVKGKNLSEKQREFLHVNCEPRHFYPAENLTAYPSIILFYNSLKFKWKVVILARPVIGYPNREELIETAEFCSLDPSRLRS